MQPFCALAEDENRTRSLKREIESKELLDFRKQNKTLHIVKCIERFSIKCPK